MSVRYTPNPNAERDLKRMVIGKLLPRLRSEVARVPCPDHDHEATVVSDPTIGWKIVGGCETVRAAALDRLVEQGLVKRN